MLWGTRLPGWALAAAGTRAGQGRILHLVHAVMLGECCASNRTIPSDDVDDAWGHASLERQLAHPQRAQRGLLCHLAMQ